MESLRRLTNSVFDSNSRLGGVVRRNSASGSAINVLLHGTDDAARALDLTFITERLIVTGSPVTTATNKKANEINIDELAQYLETQHSNHYLVFNLNSLEDTAAAGTPGSACVPPAVDWNVNHHPSLMEQLLKKTPQHHHSTASADAQSIAKKMREQMLEFSWERDGMKAHTPPFDLIFRICYSIFAWLSLDSQNVALVHCQTGKTRSGVVVACYLLYARLVDDPIDAFVEFYRKRWDMRSLTPQALRSKTPPSIQRFLASFHELIEYQKPPNEKPMLLKAIIFRALPVELQPCVQIWDDYKMIFCTDSMPALGTKDAPVLDWNGDDGFFAILWENGIGLDGGFSILCSFGDDYDSGDEVDASSRVLFRYADSTWFLNPGLVTLTKNKLDMMKQYEHGFDEDLFSVDLVLHEHSGKARRNYVRLDYTGNNAVRQGLIEITKHHLVLPDPAMHSNFIRMGFGETPTTFALQRSQNAPNVALDLLHSEGLAACFASENPAKTAQNEADSSEQMPAGEPTMNNPPLRRQTTAEIVAMQSQRSRYSIPTAIDASICHICKDDDYMMRPQIVRCTGRCGHFYHTMCVGLRKIPFGLTTMSDRTNHGIYMKKFFSAWECDSCAPPPAAVATASTSIAVPPGMTLVPSAWANSYVPSAATTANESANGAGHFSPVGGISAPPVPSTSAQSMTRAPTTSVSDSVQQLSLGSESASESSSDQHEGPSDKKIDKLREFLLASGVSVEDLLRAATTPNVLIASATNAALDGSSSVQMSVTAGGSPTSDSPADPSPSNHSQSSDGRDVSTNSGSMAYGAASSAAQRSDMSPSSNLELAASSVSHHTFVQTVQVASSQSASSENGEGGSAHARKEVPSPHHGLGLNAALMQQLVSTTAKKDTATRPQAPDLKSALLDDIAASRKKPDDAADASSNGSSATPSSTKYEMMLKRGVPFEAVQNCMKKDGVDPSTLRHSQSDSGSPSLSPEENPTVDTVKLKDVDEFKGYFNMLRLGCPKEAVKQKVIMDGLDPIIVDFGPDAIYDDVKDKISNAVPVAERSKLQDDIRSVREPKSQGSRGQAAQSSKSPTESSRKESPSSKEEMKADSPDDALLKNHQVYSKYFKMLKMGLPEDAVRHKMKSEGADERALELGGDTPFSKLSEASGAAAMKIGDDPVYAKYFKMLKMGLPEGAVRHKMITDGVDTKAFDLGPDAPISELTTAAGKTSASKHTPGLKPKQRRKKLHWQAISEDRLSSINQQTIWEDKDDDAMEFDMDMDELESLFFANNDANSAGSGKKKSSQGSAKPLKRKQSVTLIDGKRAMNAAISLARVKLSYSEIAEAVRAFDPKGLTTEQLIGINEFLPTPEEVAAVSAYAGDVTILGEVRCAFWCPRSR